MQKREGNIAEPGEKKRSDDFHLYYFQVCMMEERGDDRGEGGEGRRFFPPSVFEEKEVTASHRRKKGKRSSFTWFDFREEEGILVKGGG